ncbi:MAG: hypothetical protein ABI744_07840 [Chloroflexota bacterium]
MEDLAARPPLVDAGQRLDDLLERETAVDRRFDRVFKRRVAAR